MAEYAGYWGCVVEISFHIDEFLHEKLSVKYGWVHMSRFSHWLGAVHMSRASQANWADLSHENLYFSTTQRFI